MAARHAGLFASAARRQAYLRAARRALTGGRGARESGAVLRIVTINDVYELHSLPHLKTLINEQKPDLVTLVRSAARIGPLRTSLPRTRRRPMHGCTAHPHRPSSVLPLAVR
jgi:hypothetical protein